MSATEDTDGPLVLGIGVGLFSLILLYLVSILLCGFLARHRRGWFVEPFCPCRGLAAHPVLPFPLAHRIPVFVLTFICALVTIVLLTLPRKAEIEPRNLLAVRWAGSGVAMPVVAVVLFAHPLSWWDCCRRSRKTTSSSGARCWPASRPCCRASDSSSSWSGTSTSPSLPAPQTWANCSSSCAFRSRLLRIYSPGCIRSEAIQYYYRTTALPRALTVPVPN